MRKTGTIGLAFFVGLAGIAGYAYWRHEQTHPSTSDAYVQAHVVRVAAQVSGPAVQVFVQDQQPVSKGTALFEIDPAPYRIAVERAQAQLDEVSRQNAAAQAMVAAAGAGVRDREAQLTDAAKNATRIQRLVARGDLPPSRRDDAEAALKGARAAVQAARAKLTQAREQAGDTGDANARLRAARAALAAAQLDLKHTRVSASADGVISHMDLRPGTFIQAGQPLFALVEDDDWWVDANYKETDLMAIHPGQSATVTLDMYPDRTFRGVVRSIDPASGVAFALLPPENATGNWVKVTQRFPVKVALVDPGRDRPLRVGASAKVVIDTASPPGGASPP